MQMLIWLSCWVQKGGMFVQEIDACSMSFRIFAVTGYIIGLLLLI